MSIIIDVLLGIPLLLWGRKLFWLFVGGVGFIAGFELADRFLATNQEWVLIVVGLGLGVVGVMLALAMQKFALTLAGFIAGLYLAYRLIDVLNVGQTDWLWVIVLAGGVLGSLLILSVFDWAIILLSSLVGASLVSQVSLQGMQLELSARLVVFGVLLLVGILIQSSQKQRDSL